MANVEISICFTTYDDNFNFIKLTEALDIMPSKVRKRLDFPAQSINSGIATNEWVMSIRKENCSSVSEILDQVQQIFNNKEYLIIELCKRYDLSITVSIVIDMEEGNGPEIVLSKENIKFLSNIDAEVGFDVYIV
jgi:hypothetical protein